MPTRLDLRAETMETSTAIGTVSLLVTLLALPPAAAEHVDPCKTDHNHIHFNNSLGADFYFAIGGPGGEHGLWVESNHIDELQRFESECGPSDTLLIRLPTAA